MVPSIARQSVIIKCNMQKSVLTGNYEYYYAGRAFKKLCGVDIADEIEPAPLQELLEKSLKSVETKDEKEAWLVGMLKDYRPEDHYDDQMKELFYGAVRKKICGRSSYKRRHKG